MLTRHQNKFIIDLTNGSSLWSKGEYIAARQQLRGSLQVIEKGARKFSRGRVGRELNTQESLSFLLWTVQVSST